MGSETGTGMRKGKSGHSARGPGSTPARSTGGFKRAGGLIGTQLGTVAARRGYVQARLLSLWAEIAGPQTAAMCWPIRLAPARGPAGGILTLGVSGANAPLVQMQLPALRDRVNAALGPASVGRIQIVHTAPQEARATPAEHPASARVPVDLGDTAERLSSIGDDDLRGALETLARNVLSRA